MSTERPRLPRGSKDVFLVETVASQWLPGMNTMTVSLVREASLNDDLSEVTWRRVKGVRIDLGRDSGIPEFDISTEAAEWLRDALVKAMPVRDEAVSA